MPPPFRSAGKCLGLFSSAGTVPPLFLLGGGGFDAPFRLFEQREHFSCFPFFPYHGEERTICLPSRPNFLFPLSPVRSEERTFYVLPPLFGEGRSVFRRRRKGVGVFGETGELLRTETNLKKTRRLLPPRARTCGRAAPLSEREARGCLPAPQIRCARKREDRCRVLKYWRAFPPSRR